MRAFVSADLQKHLRDVLDAAEGETAVLVNRGQPRVVMMSVAEYRRIKALAGEPVPAAALTREPLVLRGKPVDPLGYDTSDLGAAGAEVADDYISGRTKEAVREERARVVKRLGLCGKAKEGGAAPPEGKA